MNKNKQRETKYARLQIKGQKKLDWIHLSKMEVNLMAQREFREAWANDIFKNFDLDKFKPPYVNHVGGKFHILDGQHGIAALKKWLGKWQDQMVECWVYEGLSEKEEAEMYLSLNNVKRCNVFESFRISLRAERKEDVDIHDVVLSKRLVVSKQDVPGKITAVGALRKVAKRDGLEALGRALELLRDSFGDAGLSSAMIGGFGLLCHRYNGVLNPNIAVKALTQMHAGINGLLNQAVVLRNKTGSSKSDCIAAATVTQINRFMPKGKKLPSWWKE